MEPEIARLIEYLDRRIQKMQSARTQLMELFSGDDAAPISVIASPFGGKPVVEEAAAIPRFPRTNGVRRPTRKQQIESFIRAHGPSTRVQIIEGTRIPLGTTAGVLNDKEMFENRDGVWHLRQA